MSELESLVSGNVYSVMGNRDKSYFLDAISNYPCSPIENLQEVMVTADLCKACRDENTLVYILAGESIHLGEYTAYFSEKHGLRIVVQHIHHKYARRLGWGA